MQYDLEQMINEINETNEMKSKLINIHYEKNILNPYSDEWKEKLKDPELNKRFMDIAKESAVNDIKIKIKILELMPTDNEYKSEALRYLKSMLNEK